MQRDDTTIPHMDPTIGGLLLVEHLIKGLPDSAKFRAYLHAAIEELTPKSDSEVHATVTQYFRDYRQGSLTLWAAAGMVVRLMQQRGSKGTPRVPSAPSHEPGLPSHPTADDILTRLDTHKLWCEEMSHVLWDEHARAAMRQASTNLEIAIKYVREKPVTNFETMLDETNPEPRSVRMDER